MRSISSLTIHLSFWERVLAVAVAMHRIHVVAKSLARGVVDILEMGKFGLFWGFLGF